jgi:SPP1 gp7 family putative phage head morphogenesis protein
VSEQIAGIARQKGINVAAAAKKGTAARFGMAGGLNRIDRKVLETIAFNQAAFVRDEFGNRAAAMGVKAKGIVANGLRRGLGREDMRAALQDGLGKFAEGRSANYWRTVGNYMANTARSYANLSAFAAAGVQQYRLEAVIDRATTPQCRWLDGKIMSVPDGMRNIEQATPQNVLPWLYMGPTDPQTGARPMYYKDTAGARQTVASVPRQGPVTGGAADARLQAAGIDTPPFHGNCFPAGTLVQGRFEGGLRVPYAGKLVEVKTGSGRSLAATPNHRVLTPRGFVPIKDLEVGDHLLRHCGGVEHGAGLAAVAALDDEHDAPAAIEDVLGALHKVGALCKVDRLALDLDGDELCFKGDVDVIGTYGALLHDVELARAQGSGERVFKLPALEEPLLCRACAGDPSFERVAVAAPRIVRSSDLGVALLGAHARPLDVLRFGPAAKLNASRYEVPAHRRLADASFLRELLDAAAGTVALDEVAEVRDHSFLGHVFDLRSPLGWFVASDYYVSNSCADGRSAEAIRGADARAG